MALVLDPRTGQLVQVPDNSRAAAMQAQAQQPVTGPRGAMAPLSPRVPTGSTATLTPEQAYAQGLQTTPPVGMDPDVPTVPGQTWPLQPLAVSAGVVPPEQAPVTGARTAADLAPVNAGIARALQEAKPQAPIYQAAERGNYNQYNTNVAALPQPVGAGLNFGFGVNGAPSAQQVLQNYAIQDAMAAQRQAETQRRFDRAALDSHLADAIQNGNPIAIRAQLARINAFDRGNQSLQPEIGANTRAQLNAGTELQLGTMRSGDVKTQARADLIARLLAADIAGQYGVQAATAKAAVEAQKELIKARSPEGRKAAAEAALAETRLNAINAGVAANQLDNAGVIAATRSGQEPQARVYINPLTGAPLSPEEIALLQQQQLRQLQPIQ